MIHAMRTYNVSKVHRNDGRITPWRFTSHNILNLNGVLYVCVYIQRHVKRYGRAMN